MTRENKMITVDSNRIDLHHNFLILSGYKNLTQQKVSMNTKTDKLILTEFMDYSII